MYDDTQTSITQWEMRLPRRPRRQLCRLRPALTIVAGVLAYLAGYAIGHHAYSVPGGYHWTAARQLLACNQVVSMNGTFPATSGCAHARELVLAGNLLPVLGVALVVTGIVLAVVATVVVLGAAVVVLRQDVQALQAQHSTPNPTGVITCTDLQHVRLLVHGRTARCTTR